MAELILYAFMILYTQNDNPAILQLLSGKSKQNSSLPYQAGFQIYILSMTPMETNVIHRGFFISE